VNVKCVEFSVDGPNVAGDLLESLSRLKADVNVQIHEASYSIKLAYRDPRTHIRTLESLKEPRDFPHAALHISETITLIFKPSCLKLN